MRVLVTGASGFVGRRVVECLAADGHRLTACYRSAMPGALESAARWVGVGDIEHFDGWRELLADVDIVVHLAGLAHLAGPHAQADAAEYQRVNCRATARLAEAVRDAGTVRRLLFLSSVVAMGSSAQQVLDEASPCTPDNPYGQSKLAAEEVLRRILQGADCPEWTILRPVVVYGPGNQANMARLFGLVRRGWPIPLAQIRNRRSFVHIDNLVDAIAVACTSAGAARRTFLVADDEVVSTPELIRVIAEAMGRRARLFAPPAWVLGSAIQACEALGAVAGRSVGLDRYAYERLSSSLAASNQALKRATGWRPRLSLGDGIRQTLESAADASAVPFTT